MSAMAEPQVITFGCRLNAYESEVVRRNAETSDLRDVVIVNTCAVTAEAGRQARQSIRRARRDRPKAKIIVTGCAAQLDPDGFAAMPEVDQVLGNAEKLDPINFGAATGEKVLVNDIMSVTETAGHLIDGLEGRARAFVQVQNGCDHRCTFCVIPFARGPSRSIPAGAVVDQIRRLVANGYREAVLTGVDITAYGSDLPGDLTLSRLVESILRNVPGLDRLRLSSLDPVDIDGALLGLLAHEPRLMPHLHLSLQAGDDMVLRRMKRRHTRDDAVDICARVRTARPDVALGADLIAGFPTESDAMFENTLRLVDDCELTFLHVFPYSARPDTPAACMPKVPGEVVKERAARLRQAGEDALVRFLDNQAGRRTDILMETADSGRTPQFATVRLAQTHSPGDLIPARILGRDGHTLTGETA